MAADGLKRKRNNEICFWNAAFILDFMKRLVCLFWIGWIGLLVLPIQAQKIADRYVTASGGGETFSITLRDSILMHVKAKQDHLARLYEDFWLGDTVKIGRDISFGIDSDPAFSNGIRLSFGIKAHLARTDTNFDQHRRLGIMFIQHLRNYVGQDSLPIFWRASVDSTAFSDKLIQNQRLFGSKGKVVAQVPIASDSMRVVFTQRSQGRGGELKMIELAQGVIAPHLPDLIRAYKPFLNFEGLVYGRDVNVSLEPHPIDDNALLLRWALRRRAISWDKDLSEHRQLLPQLVKEWNAITVASDRPPWLHFTVVVDTTLNDDKFVVVGSVQ